MFVGPHSSLLTPHSALSPPEARNESQSVYDWSNSQVRPPPSHYRRGIRYKLKAQLQITSDNQKQFNIIILVDLPPLPSPPPPPPPSLEATFASFQKY